MFEDRIKLDPYWACPSARPNTEMSIGVDPGIPSGDISVISVGTTVSIDENGNIVATNMTNNNISNPPIGVALNTNEIVDHEGNVVSTITYSTYGSLFDDTNDNGDDIFSNNPTYPVSRERESNQKIQELTEKVNKLEKLVKKFIQKEEKIYKEAKENNRHDNAISDLEIE